MYIEKDHTLKDYRKNNSPLSLIADKIEECEVFNSSEINLFVKINLKPGTGIDTAAYCLCDYATNSGVLLRTQFSGISIYVKPNSDPERLIEKIETGIKLNKQDQIIVSE